MTYDNGMFRINTEDFSKKILNKCNSINEEIYKYINETTVNEMNLI